MPVTRFPPVYPLPSEAMEKAPEANWYTSLSSLMYPSSPVMFGPNISGEIVSANVNQVSENGPFFLEDAINGPSGGDTSNNLMVCIDASRTNSCYGAATTVQPASVRVLACVKI